MFDKYVIRLLLFSLFCVLLFSCDKEDNGIVEEKAVELASFAFLKKDNPSLEQDVIVDLAQADENDVIELFVPHLVTDSLVACFSGVYDTVEVNGEEQKSGVSRQDFNNKVIYNLKAFSGESKNYEFHIIGYNGIPIIKIETESGNPILSKTEYLGAAITIKNIPQYNVILEKGKIRGRGNATFGWDKKPYKIKFSNAIAPFGFSTNKDWVLLAMWNDKSLLRESIMADVSRRIGEPFTINTQHVDLFLNEEYRGTYLLVDHIEKGESRIDVSDDGFVIENDLYYLEEPQWFTSHSGYHYIQVSKKCN